ncbi:sulfurtransferase complex subunit TusD [Buchnera aphidicola]|uniref:Sulfurtransferase TusD n=1 Tax=Buchnera aphidicola subsp. Tuberolachnus salignus TaxID=98804 RepID=A0A170PC97_BUCTT|nr:sulfurtransferase complex subunit TusD [Buchnera aphidicola]CUR53329.1 Sulfurtransferase TusD [Buchnera aphidicola (Tuberolachnus salignus)]
MKYILTVSGPPYGTQNSNSALLFARALILKKHQLKSIFFYSLGVYNANSMIYPSQDEFNIIKSFIKLSFLHQIKLYICMNSAYQKGILSKEMALKLGFLDGNLSKNFQLTGLSTLAVQIYKCDRFIQF